MDLNRHYRTVKKIIKKSRMPDPFFASRYAFSPYMACSHACSYCDGRSERYFVTGDFEKDIIIRENIVELLKKELPAIREPGNINISSGISDPYQHLENEENHMKEISELLTDYNFSVSVATKSPLILRDKENWFKINKSSKFILMVSLTFLDDDLRKIFEPESGSVEERLDIIREFKNNNCTAGVLAMPFIPYINDSEFQINELFSRLRDLKIDFIIPGCLTLRPGIQKDVFMKIVRDNFPELSVKMNNLYKENKLSGVPETDYIKELNNRIENAARKNDIILTIPHHVYKGHFPLYDEIFILISHMIELYSKRGVNTIPLKRTLDNFSTWLGAERKQFMRKKNIKWKQFEDLFVHYLKIGKFREILKNNKMENFIKSVVLENKIFNYKELTLE